MEEVNSLDVIYSYTENSLKDTTASMSGLNLRLMSVAASCGLLLRFAADVHFERLRWLTCLVLLGAVISSALGLAAKATGSLVSSRSLVDNLGGGAPSDCKLQILSNWMVTIAEMDEKRIWKAACLNWALVSLLSAFALLAVAVVIG